MVEVYKKLLAIQKELKVPKAQRNDFGKYNYRSCEDILEEVKPHLDRVKAALLISDSLELIGNRYYVKATATVVDIETGESVSVTAFAREDESRKGMDASQITGSTSSYARKYALNGLLCIDDTKDSDATNKHETEAKKETRALKKVSSQKAEPVSLEGYYRAASEKFPDSEDANNWLQLVHWKISDTWEDDVNNIPLTSVARAANGVEAYGLDQLQKMMDAYSEEYVLATAGVAQ